MIRHTQTICRQIAKSVFDHFVGLALKGLILTSFFNIYYISEGNSSVVTMAINISGIENFTEVCRTFGSVFEVGKSGTLQLGTVNVTDVQTESLGTGIIFCYCKINQTKKQRKVFVKTNRCPSLALNLTLRLPLHVV